MSRLLHIEITGVEEKLKKRFEFGLEGWIDIILLAQTGQNL